MLNPRRIETCHQCPFNDKKPVDGKLPCLADPQRRDILVHVRDGTCPKGFHKDLGSPPELKANTIPLAGDLVAALTAKLGIDRMAKFAEKLAGKDCGCAERREWLNKWDRRLRRKLDLTAPQ